MAKRTFFKDLSPETLETLKEVYYPIFDRTSDMSLSEAFSIVEHIVFPLKETTVRTGIRYEYDMSKLANYDESVLRKEQSLDMQVHEFRRRRLVFNQEVRNAYDELMLLTDFGTLLEDFDIKPFEITDVEKEEQHKKIFVSDMHIGKYTEDQHREILSKVVSGVLSNVETDEVVELYFGGDMIDGLLRMSQIKQIKMGMVEQVFMAVQLTTDFLETLSNYVTISRIGYIDESNHDQIRPLGSGRSDFPEENLSKIISRFLVDYCEKKNIDFISGRELDLVIADRPTKFTHGDAFRSKKAMQDYYAGYFLIHGHFHSFEMTPNSLCVPPLVYGDEYTDWLGINAHDTGFIIEHNGFFKHVRI